METGWCDTLVEVVTEKFLAEQRAGVCLSGQDSAMSMLHAAGLLKEPLPEEAVRVACLTLMLDEFQANLDRVGGKPLSERILEMCGPKV